MPFENYFSTFMFYHKIHLAQAVVFDDSHSPKYQKFKTDRFSVEKIYEKQDYKFHLVYYKWKYGKELTPVKRRKSTAMKESTVCLCCGAPLPYIYVPSFLCKLYHSI